MIGAASLHFDLCIAVALLWRSSRAGGSGFGARGAAKAL